MTVTVSDFVALSRLLDEGLALPPDGQEAWLRSLAEPDRHLEATLRELLAEQAGGVDGQRRLEALPSLDAAKPASAFREGDRVGRYRLLREIGRGGMAIVWLAERHDGDITRKFALKMPLVRLTAPIQVERFERERDVLARLSHPQIARLDDAGVTPEGHPYIVLEHVDGDPIVAACDARGLDVPARLRLFLQVLGAVDHAHQHLVVHRDIKPSNVFLDRTGQVRLLDFGVAKLLPEAAASADATALTRDAGGAPLTPRYAAPEQIDGRPVSTATDVYSLGVLLHELLTGRVPHDASMGSMAEAVDAVLHGEVVPPSRAVAGSPDAARRRAALAGDLDTIVLKALRKLPAERYRSVMQFADDLRALLEHRPIAARRSSAAHRLRLWVRRHRGVSIAVAVGTATALVFAALAWSQFQRSREQFARAEAVRDFMFDFAGGAEADEDRQGEPTGRDMLAAAVRRAREGFADQPLLRGELLVELGRLQRRFADEPAAMGLLREGLTLLEAGSRPGDAPLNKARAHLASGLLAEGRVDDGAALAEGVIANCADGVQCAKARFYAHDVLAGAEMRRGRLARALDHARAGVRDSEQGFGVGDVQTAFAWHSVAVVARQAGEITVASQALDRALAVARNRTLSRLDRIQLERTGAVISLDLGDWPAARDRARELAGQVRDPDEQVLLWRLVANAQFGLGRIDDAIDAARRAVGFGDASGRGVQWLLARQSLARALAAQGDTAPALAELAGVVQGLLDAGYAATTLEVLRARRIQGEALLRAGDREAGLRTLLDVARAQAEVGAGQEVELAQADDLIGCVLREQGLAAEALGWHDKARALLSAKLPPTHPFVLRNAIYRHLADTRPRAADDDAAFTRSLTQFRNRLPDGSAWRTALDHAMAQDACRQPRGGGCRLIL